MPRGHFALLKKFIITNPHKAFNYLTGEEYRRQLGEEQQVGVRPELHQGQRGEQEQPSFFQEFYNFQSSSNYRLIGHAN